MRHAKSRRPTAKPHRGRRTSGFGRRARLSAMDSELERLVAEAMKLPPEARSALASALIRSLDTEVDESAEAAWDAEIARRIRDLDEGRTQGIPWEEARRIIRGG
jgi:putative addiction module component (TIGR02574 family)